MSKITPKNLHYDTTLPPFLARLQANNNSRDGRHEFTIARATKKRSAEEEAEDEPVYFNEESGETFTKGEWEERQKFSGEGQVLKETEEEKEKEEGEVKSKEKEKEKVAAIGVGKKRKVGKVVGGGEEENEEKQRANSTLGNAIAAAKATTASKLEEKKPEKGKAKTAKKGKKVKLSFDD